MERQTIEVHIGGQKYRLVSSVAEAELHRLAGAVSTKLREVARVGSASPSQAMFLAAMALAHEVETERRRREVLEERTRGLLLGLLVQVDEALNCSDKHDGAGVR